MRRQSRVVNGSIRRAERTNASIDDGVEKQLRSKKNVAKPDQKTYLCSCPISHVPVVVCQSVGIRTRGRTAAKGEVAEGRSVDRD